MSAITMLQRIEAERKGRKLCEIKELVLDGCTATEINGLTDEYLFLEKLSIVNVGLTTLDGLPALSALIELDVSGNPIAGGLESLKNCPNLVYLNLSGNKLPAISSLAPLAQLENLTRLELSNCELVSVEGYRKEVFALLPQLNFLDGLDQNGVEEADDKFTGDVVNGLKNGHVNEGEEDDDEEEEEEDEIEDDEEEEEEESESDGEKDDIGLSALQGSKDLEDDEEDYVPGDGDDDVEEDEEEDDEEDDKDDSVNEDDEIANLSGAGVTGPRIGQKRAVDSCNADGVTDAKVAATEDD